MDDACDYPWYFDADGPHTLPAHADDLLRDLEEFCSGEERLVSAIRAGNMVDDGMRPSDVQMFLQDSVIAELLERERRGDPAEYPYDTIILSRFADRVCVVDVNQRVRYYANQGVGDFDVLPNPNWADNILRICFEREHKDIRPNLSVLLSKNASLNEKRTAFSHLDNYIRNAHAVSLGLNYLGLVFEPHRRVVRREGYHGSLDFNGRELLWGLLDILTNSGETFLRAQEILQRLSSRNTSNDNQKTTENSLCKAISDLRGLLVVLGITICDGRRKGYRLEPRN